MIDGPPPRIAAVVVTFNRLALLQRLVPRLREVAGLAEIIVVDNASADGTGEWLARSAGADGPAGRAPPGPQPRAAPVASTRGCGWPSSAAPTWSG